MSAQFKNLVPFDARANQERLNRIKKLTLTGLDTQTDIPAMQALAAAHPFLEFGFLYSATTNGKNRFPHKNWLSLVLPLFSGRASLHVCGYMARKQLLAGELASITKHTPRVQVNGDISMEEAFLVCARVETLITQHTKENMPLLRLPVRNHSILVQNTSDERIFTDRALLHTHKKIGFSVGSTGQDIGEQRDIAKPLSKPGSWLDLKESIRVDDWLNELAVRRAITSFVNTFEKSIT
jgi:hypothetical protein